MPGKPNAFGGRYGRRINKATCALLVTMTLRSLRLRKKAGGAGGASGAGAVAAGGVRV
jgi:hypothetical protein